VPIIHRVSILISGAFLAFWVVFAITVEGQTPGVGPDPKKVKNPVAATAASVTAGAATFKKYCSFCHGADAKGDGPLAPKGSHPPNLTDDTWGHGDTDGEIFLVVHDGLGEKSAMKGLKTKLSDQDIWNVINYLRSLGPKKKKKS
jgi:mono/diheme cytochrome c family protein